MRLVLLSVIVLSPLAGLASLRGHAPLCARGSRPPQTPSLQRSALQRSDRASVSRTFTVAPGNGCVRHEPAEKDDRHRWVLPQD